MKLVGVGAEPPPAAEHPDGRATIATELPLAAGARPPAVTWTCARCGMLTGISLGGTRRNSERTTWETRR